MSDGIDLEDKVVAIFDQQESGDSAAEELRRNGYGVEVLRGEEGRRRLDPHGEKGGLLESLGHALQAVVGDEDRIVARVDDYLAEDRSFLVVEAEERREGGSAVPILRKHGGHYMWRFDQWTYLPVGGD